MNDLAGSEEDIMLLNCPWPLSVPTGKASRAGGIGAEVSKHALHFPAGCAALTQTAVSYSCPKIPFQPSYSW